MVHYLEEAPLAGGCDHLLLAPLGLELVVEVAEVEEGELAALFECCSLAPIITTCSANCTAKELPVGAQEWWIGLHYSCTTVHAISCCVRQKQTNRKRYDFNV